MLPSPLKLLTGAQQIIAEALIPQAEDDWMRGRLQGLSDVLDEIRKLLELSQTDVISQENEMLRSGLQKIVGLLEEAGGGPKVHDLKGPLAVDVGTDKIAENMTLMSVAEQVVEEIYASGGETDPKSRRILAALRSLLDQVASFEDEAMSRLDDSYGSRGRERSPAMESAWSAERRLLPNDE